MMRICWACLAFSLTCCSSIDRTSSDERLAFAECAGRAAGLEENLVDLRESYPEQIGFPSAETTGVPYIFELSYSMSQAFDEFIKDVKRDVYIQETINIVHDLITTRGGMTAKE